MTKSDSKSSWRRLIGWPLRIGRMIGFNMTYYAAIATAGVLSLSSAAAAEGNASGRSSGDLAIPFSADSASYWRFVSDRVMGGVSNGGVKFTDEDGLFYAHMTGDVSTANNGGFIQFRAGLSLAGAASQDRHFRGVRLMVRGNDQDYFVHFRTLDSRRPQDYFAQSFRATSEWQMVELPFSLFKNSRRSYGDSLDPERIRSMGIVAYGRDHEADVAVATIEFFE